MSQLKANKSGWSIFDEVFYQGVMAGQPAYDNRKSLEWFREYIKDNVRTANAFKKTSNSLESKIIVGHMYVFQYHAKYAEELDYWDACPIVFPFADEGETFLGINLHYAPPKARIVIMKALYTLISDTKMDQKTKLRLTYKKLNRMAAFPYFKPLIKRYRKDHVRSLFVKVEVRYWPIAVFLPLAKWQKQNANTVYRDFNAGTRTASTAKLRKVKPVKKAKI